MAARRSGAVRILVAVVALASTATWAVPVGAATSTLQLTTATLPGGTLGSAYSVTLGASGGAPPYSWSVASGPLPGGLLLSSTGTLDGVPGVAGTAMIAMRVTDTLGATVVRNLSFTATAPPPPPEALFGVNAAGALAPIGAGVVAPGAPAVGPVVGLASTPSGSGLWIASSAGAVTGVGVASLGSVAPSRLRGRIVAIAALPSGAGYYLLSSTGHVYGFGTARVRGRGSLRGRGRAVGIAVPANGRGYLVARADGEVFAFAGARDSGGIAPRHRAGPIVGIATLPGGGYLLVSARGRVTRFGAAVTVALPRPRPTSAVAIAAAPAGRGYFVVAADGSVFPAGSARQLGSLQGAAPVAAVAAAP